MRTASDSFGAHLDGQDIEFCVIAEAGALEAQALLLCKSIRKFAGECSSAKLTVVSPRATRRPSRSTLRELDALNAEYLDLDLESPCPAYGPSFKVFVAGHVARRPGPPILVQIDSDTLFLQAPDFSLEPHIHAAARPVDVKGMCTAGEGDPFEGFWRQLCDLCDVDYGELPYVVTTVDRQTVRASYNGGLIAARRASCVFERAEEFFRRLLAANLRPHPSFKLRTGAGLVEGEGSQFWGTSQAVLSLALTAIGGGARILPPSYNVPLHLFRGDLSVPPIHVHYHWLCEPRTYAENPLLDGRIRLPEETTAWLREQLPLRARKNWFRALSSSRGTRG